MREIATSRDIVCTGVQYTRLANMGLGILQKREQHLTPSIRSIIQQEVTSAGHSGLQRFLEGGAYQNLESLLSTLEGISWLSEREIAVKDLHRLFLELHRGHKRGVEMKAKDWLNLCKERGWGAEKTLAARVLSAYNAC